MSDQIPEIQAIGADFAQVEDNIKRAEAMIALARDAGENTTEWQAQLRDLKVKKDKWAQALAKRGVNVSSGG